MISAGLTRGRAGVIRRMRIQQSDTKIPLASSLSNVAERHMRGAVRNAVAIVPDGGNGLVESRRAIDDEELGTLKPALDEIVEPRAPSLGALAGHALDRKQDPSGRPLVHQHNE